ncbi:Fur-regulated protein [Enterobacter soli]|uniref:Fur-regulated protein n=1 Tax=Enterobacter soli TaxID=885040 RepID=UPI003EDA0429
MSEKIINLSGRATDVLYALFFRGALHSGNLPSKSGAAELRELGFAESRHTATEYLKTNHFTFLTAQGQEFAIENLVKTRFGVPVGGYLGEDSGKLNSAGIGISIEGDQRKVVFEAGRFKVHKAAQSTSNNEEPTLNGGLDFGGFPGVISHDHDDRNNATKTILTDEMREAIISAVRESDLFTSLQTAIAAQEASTSDLKQALNDAVGDAIRNAIKPGGALWAAISHR